LKTNGIRKTKINKEINNKNKDNLILLSVKSIIRAADNDILINELYYFLY
jgi:hypothetical protein